MKLASVDHLIKEMDNYYNNYEYRWKLISEKSVSTDTRSALKNQHQDKIWLKLKIQKTRSYHQDFFCQMCLKRRFRETICPKNLPDMHCIRPY